MSEKSGGEFINFKYPDLQKSDQVQRSVKKKQRIEGLETPNNPTDRNEVFLDRLENIFENPDIEIKGKRLENILNNPDIGNKEEALKILKQQTKDRNIKLFKNRFLYPAVLIDKNNVPDSYLELQIKIARVEGRGGDLGYIQTAKNIPIETKKQYGETLYKDQKESLDTWVDYLSSPDASYPTWFKYYTLKSVLKLGTYDKENHAFKNRLKDTVAVFPELNRAALAKVNDILINKYGTEYFQLREEISTTESKLAIMDDYERRLIVAKTGKGKDGRELHIKKKDLEKMEQSLLRNPVSETNKDELTKKLTDLTDKQKQYLQLRNIPDKFTGIPEEEDFGKIYAYAIHEMTPASKENKEKIEGKWSKFKQGDDPTTLFESLQGHGLEWCTAGGMETARTQLKNGDFYVYYSKDENGLNTIPRIAIRMENDQVAEVRGINSNQNLEANMTDIAQEKYHQLPGGEKFDKKDHDMKLLTLIDTKVNNNQELTKREIIFLYELEGSIEGFGYQTDPRIKEIRGKRIPKLDAPIVFDCQPNKIAWSQEELNNETKAYLGPLFPGIFKDYKNIENIYTSFPEGKISRQSLEVGGKSAGQLKSELKQNKININGRAEQMMNKSEFKILKSPEVFDLIHLKVRDLGFINKPTTEELYETAKQFGLELCPPEVGPELRLKDKDLSLYEYKYIAMKPITGSGSDPYVFELERRGDGLWLVGYWVDPDACWEFGSGMIFSLRK